MEQPNVTYYKQAWESITMGPTKEPVDEHMLWETIQMATTPEGITLLVPHTMVLVHTPQYGCQYLHVHTDPEWTTDSTGYLLACPIMTNPKACVATPDLLSPKWDRQTNMRVVTNLLELTIKMLAGKRKYHLKRWNCRHAVKHLMREELTDEFDRSISTDD